DAPERGRQRAAERGLADAVDAAAAAGGIPDHRMRAAAVPHLRADGVRPAGHARGRAEPADSESARHQRIHRGTEEVPGQHA
nr:hypothetical protein [Tanacetum cinerariifolium]